MGAPSGATHYLERFSDQEGLHSSEPVAGGLVEVMFYADGQLVQTIRGTIG
jgi:hypothetical protein